VERLVRLYAGLSGFGISLALMVRARLGVGPWDVLHQGIARQLGVQIGWVVIAIRQDPPKTERKTETHD
jgi:uncharacterized membrane protein YczE